ncbi:MAG TPA: hypothetical protein VG755_11155 [Nannocystaceae bacterium]|nr:hypothetical protein [Nannocystaceae bacterium]
MTMLLALALGLAPPAAEDLLGDLEVDVDHDRVQELPPFRIALLRAGMGDVADRVHEILRNDLLAFGRFVIIDHDESFTATRLDGVVTAVIEPFVDDTHVVTALVRIGAQEHALEARVVGPTGTALGGHRLADEVVGVFTGRPAAFSAPLAIVRTEERTRRAYRIDIDGGDELLLSRADAVVSTVAFTPTGKPAWAASVANGTFDPIGAGARARLHPRGSVYGLAWSADGTRSAAAIAQGNRVRIWIGDGELTHLEPISDVEIGLGPVFLTDNRVAWAGTRRNRRRVWVDRHAVSPVGIDASAPTFCDHPTGPRLVWVEHVGRGTRLVVADVDGRHRRELPTRAVRVGSPTCAVDGRMVAYVVTEGAAPGLWIANLDRWRPRRMSAQIGDSLRWSPRRR